MKHLLTAALAAALLTPALPALAQDFLPHISDIVKKQPYRNLWQKNVCRQRPKIPANNWVCSAQGVAETDKIRIGGTEYYQVTVMQPHNVSYNYIHVLMNRKTVVGWHINKDTGQNRVYGQPTDAEKQVLQQMETEFRARLQ